jgi:prepilin-type N-terminal cleavage/methylation domain-containing protein
MRNHKGFTLIELMIGIIIMLVVSGSIYKLLTTTQRVARAQAERTDLQSNLRAASIVVPTELREINTVVGGTVSQNDILSMTATSITYRAMRGIGYVCQVPLAGEIRLLASSWSGLRLPDAARDSAYVFIENAENLSSDDAWQPVRFTAVTASTCGAAAAYSLTINPTVAALTSVPVRTPVRVYEVIELSLYNSGGQSWLGARSVSAGEVAPQPLLGPLVGATGLAFSYLDVNGNVTAVPANVKSIRMTVTGVTSQIITRGATSQMSLLQDTIVSQVALRNSFRP